MSWLKLSSVRIIFSSLVALAGCTGNGTSGNNPGAGPAMESCGNGQDEDGDGLVDEGCDCVVGQTQSCWPGHPDQRGEGICQDGMQVCEAVDEFIAWGPCVGTTMPADNDVDGDGVDSDCGGTDGPDEQPTACVANELGEGCFNGRDEDCDGLVDCDDPDCTQKCAELCVDTETNCEDGLDNDCDHVIDCNDANCGSDCSSGGGDGGPGGPGVCTEEEFNCGDHVDDDCDSRVDCADSDCTGSPSCSGGVCIGPPVPEACWDAWDDDCDGLTDCADSDCAASVQCNTSCRCVPGGVRWCDTPTACTWGRQTCNPDGSWGSCVETSSRPGSCGGTFYDPECCASAANTCCQDYPASGSIGECAGIINCM